MLTGENEVASSLDLCNHWAPQPEWETGRRLLALYITFAGQPALTSCLQELQQSLAGLSGMDLISPEWFHVTISGVDFVDQLDPSAIDAIREAAVRELAGCGPLRLSIGRPGPDEDAVSVPVQPAEGVVHIRDRINKVIRHALAGRMPYRLPEPTGGFQPHISLAYANRTVPWRVLRPILAPIEDPAITFTVTDVTLLELSRRNASWTWVRPQSISIV